MNCAFASESLCLSSLFPKSLISVMTPTGPAMSLHTMDARLDRIVSRFTHAEPTLSADSPVRL